MALYFRTPRDFGGELGTAFGTGLGEGLQQLAQKKLNELTRQRQAQGLSSLLNIPLAEAQGIAALDPKLQSIIAQQKLREPIQKTLADIARSQYGSQGTASPLDEISQAGAPSGSQGMGALNIPQGAQLDMPTAKFVSDIAESRRREALQKEKIGIQRQGQIQKSYESLKQPLQEIREKGARARDDIKSFKGLLGLSRSNQLYQGGLGALADSPRLTKLGLNKFFTNPATDQARALISQLVTGAAGAFNTGRLTNLDIEKYEQALPALWQTKEGFEAIAQSGILANQAKEDYAKISAQVAKEYADKKLPYPPNMIDIIDERAEPMLKKYADQSMQGIEKAVYDNAAKNNEFPKLPDKDLPEGAVITWPDGLKFQNINNKWKYII